jgi:2-keto-3-deoxy-L-rhamnonate aldolase RhmA
MAAGAGWDWLLLDMSGTAPDAADAVPLRAAVVLSMGSS